MPASRALTGQATLTAAWATVVAAADDPMGLIKQNGPDLSPGAVTPEGDGLGDAEGPGVPVGALRRSHEVTVTPCASTPFLPCWVSKTTR